MIKDRLIEARRLSGMSLRQAVRFSGGRITSTTVEALENGVRQPTDDELVVLAETYEVRLEWLRLDTDNGFSSLTVNARGLDGLAPNDVAKLVLQLKAHRQ